MTKQDYAQKLQHPKWQKKKSEIQIRDKFTCQLCGDKEMMLQVHHIAYTGDPWTTPDKLLILLCRDCHEEETANLKEASTLLIQKLKRAGFMSSMMFAIPVIFQDTDRGWTGYDPAIDVLKMVVDDDELWHQMHELYFERLHQKTLAREAEEEKNKNSGDEFINI